MAATKPPASALEWALALVGDRWSLLVVQALLDGPKRFGDLSEAVPGIAPNILSHRLKHLERGGVVAGERYSSRPPRLSYELTARGRELGGALRLLEQWGSACTDNADHVRHAACGGPVEPRWWCATCDVAVEDPEADGLRFV